MSDNLRPGGVAHFLAGSETKFAAIWESGILAMVVGEPGGRLLAANDRFLDMVGWTREELERRGISRSDYVLPEWEPPVWASTPFGVAASQREQEFRRKDGTRVPVLVGGARLDERTFVGFAVDLTEKRLIDDELRETKRRFDALWRSGMVGIAIADNDGAILEANDEYLGMIGYVRGDLDALGLRYTDLTPVEQRWQLVRVGALLSTQGYAEPVETETLCKDGTRRPVMVGVAAIDVQRNIAFVADLAERKRAEDELRRTREQLLHAQKMEAIGRLAGSVAHDFNNLLSVMITYPRMLLDGLDPRDPMCADLQHIIDAGERASELTRQLLLFSRQQVVEPKVVDLNEIVGRMQRMIERLIGEDITLSIEPGEGLGHALADPGHIEQVVMNLVVNARDAMPGGGNLTIETANVTLDEEEATRHEGARPGRYVVLSVDDTGCGMEEGTLARIFEPFFTTKGAGKGTGLGLSTVFGIVRQSGGHVRVRSAPGEGSTFLVYLPRLDAAVDAVPAPAAAPSLHGSETVLLVEDEDEVRAVVRRVLRRYGYTVLEARNAGEALLLTEQHPSAIDLLLTDVVMPGMNGPELARRLQPLRPRMRVLCMSGYTDDSVVRHGEIDRGMGFLQKPITPERLARKLREILDPIPRA